VVGIAKEAVDRLSAKLAGVKGSGQPVDMAEEFRMLTLQVIGEAILSLPPEECDQARAGAGLGLGFKQGLALVVTSQDQGKGMVKFRLRSGRSRMQRLCGSPCTHAYIASALKH